MIDLSALAASIQKKLNVAPHIAKAAAEISIASKAKGVPLSAADLSAVIADLHNKEEQNKKLFLAYVQRLSPVQQSNVVKQVTKLIKAKGFSGFGAFGIDIDWGALASGFGKVVVGVAPVAGQVILGKMALDKTPNIPPPSATPEQQKTIAERAPVSEVGLFGGISPWMIGGGLLVIGGFIFFMMRKPKAA